MDREAYSWDTGQVPPSCTYKPCQPGMSKQTDATTDQGSHTQQALRKQEGCHSEEVQYPVAKCCIQAQSVTFPQTDA